MKRFSYKNVGVDIEKGDAFVQAIKPSRHESIAIRAAGFWPRFDSIAKLAERRSRLS